MPFPARASSLIAALLALAGPLGAAGDPARGAQLFQQNCAVCHASGRETRLAPGQGPALAGIVGRRAASLADFGYTRALAAAGITWDAPTLERFLAGPGVLVPGTAMVIVIPSPADRRDLVAFLATLRPVADAGRRLQSHVRTPGDWQNDAPGVSHRIALDALPAPYATRSAGNSPRISDPPPGAVLAVPPGFQVRRFASGLSGPRLLRTAPNGDLFIAETGRGRIRVLRAPDGADAPSENSIYAEGLEGPFGIAFFPRGEDPRWVYVATLNSVIRFPYRNGDLRAGGPPETVVPVLAPTTGGHTTRDVAFSLDGRRLYISVGSGSNVAEGMAAKSPAEVRAWEAAHARASSWGDETGRADILVADPAGGGLRVFATGIRNAVGLAVQPGTGRLWAATNERDGLGDDLVPDYLTHVEDGGYYGWPWFYLGNHEDPRHAGERPDLAGAALVPDVPVQAHSAALELTFYPVDVSGPSAFPAAYRGDLFAAFHGSWNRSGRTGSKVVRVHLANGVATGEYEDFLTGFVIDDGHVWGRPVGVTVARDGALIVTDDANDTVWRISYSGR